MTELEADKLQHEMYWNETMMRYNAPFGIDKLQHEMYWNALGADYSAVQYLINYNMRCIETSTIDTLRFPNPDKLQHEMSWNDRV